MIPQAALRTLLDPLQFVPQMIIRDRNGMLTSMQDAVHPDGSVGLYDEQWLTLFSLAQNTNTIVLKARKLGITTVAQAFFVHRGLTTPGSKGTLCVGHERGSCRLVNSMQDTFLDGIMRQPRTGQPGMGFGHAMFERIRPTNTEINTVAQGLDHSAWAALQAGGRGTGRSFTYHYMHGTEVAYYPLGSSAQAISAKSTEETADAAAWAAMDSSLTCEGDERRLMESTANGPRGIFYKYWLASKQKDSQWAHEFFPWYECSAYVRKPWAGFELNDEERLLQIQHNLTLDQLAWRRAKLMEPAYDILRFRREYPFNELEPFMVSGNLWYPTEILRSMGSSILQQEVRAGRDGWRYYAEPGFEPGERDPERTYFIGVDPSGGTGRDFSVFMVMNDKGRVVAIFSDNLTDPHGIANLVYRESLVWGGARILCEGNGVGGAVIERLTSLRANLWKTGSDTNLRDFWSDPNTKLGLCSELRAALLNRYLTVNDDRTLVELMGIRQQKTGRIEADEGSFDDHAMALALVWWNAKQYVVAEIGRMTAEKHAYRIREDRAIKVKKQRERVENILPTAKAEANYRGRAEARRRLRGG